MEGKGEERRGGGGGTKFGMEGSGKQEGGIKRVGGVCLGAGSFKKKKKGVMGVMKLTLLKLNCS